MRACVLSPLGVKECDTNESELDGHVEPQDMEEYLENWPFLGSEKPPSSWRQDKSVPGGDCERTDEEVLVRRQVWWQVEGRREERGGVGHG
jgi:hypothetical protein